MNELLEILKELHPDVDYENCTTLIDDKILDSFDIVSIISEVSDSFDVAFRQRRLFRRILILQKPCMI